MMTLALYDKEMFLLTRREQMVLVLVLISLLAGTGIRQLRMMHQLPGEASATLSLPH